MCLLAIAANRHGWSIHTDKHCDLAFLSFFLSLFFHFKQPTRFVQMRVISVSCHTFFFYCNSPFVIKIYLNHTSCVRLWFATAIIW